MGAENNETNSNLLENNDVIDQNAENSMDVNREDSSDHAGEVSEHEYAKRVSREERRYKREQEALKRELESLRNQVNYYQNNNETKKEPDFDTPEGVMSALDHLVERRISEREINKKFNDSKEKINKVLESAREKYEDFDDLVSDCDSMYGAAPDGIADAIQVIKNADDVIYSILKDKKEYKSLMSKTAPEVIARLSEISAKIALGSSKVSKAPPPIKPLQFSSTSSSAQKSFAERRAELRSSYNSRKR